MSNERLRASLADRYTVERELGQGGMATVYLAHDIKHQRKVAIKVLKPELAAVLGADRFVQEITTTAALQHPHILPLFDSGVADSFLYYVMPFIDGETLRAKLDRETQLGIDEAVKITTDVAGALDYAHRHGVIHRDIKPENILLHDGRPMVADFGIALAVSAAAGGRMTETGLSLGTPHYMSPEQATAEKEITARSDIYSLGSVLYEMLTGNPPHTGASAQQIIMKIVTEDAAPVTKLRKSVPDNVAAAVGKSLEKLPADRFESARAFAEALSNPSFTTLRVASGVGTGPAAARRFGGWIRSAWSWAALAVIGVLAAGVVLSPRVGGSTGGVTFTQKTFNSDAILTARFAPDGKTLVFSGTTPGAAGTTPRLYVIRPDYPDAVPLGPDSTNLLAISSSGELAVLTGATYLGHRLFTGTLATMPLGGGAPREVLARVREADWSPDGKSMAVTRAVDGVDRLEYPIGTVLATSTGYFSDPRVSPSGNEIAVFEHPTAYDDRGIVVIIDRNGKRTSDSTVHWALEGLAWQPDGGRVLFSATLATAGSYTSLATYAMDHQGHERPSLSSAGGLTLQDISHDGRWLVTHDEIRYMLYVRPPGASEDRDLGWLDMSDSPALSADGQLVAFSDQGISGGINYTVLLRKTDGSPAARLGEGMPLVVSHDAKWLLVLVQAAPPRVMLYPTGAGEPRRLDQGQFESIQYGSGDISSDGTRYGVCGNLPKKGPQCFVGATTGGPATAITPEGVVAATFSPDFDRVVAQVGDSFQLIPVAGGPARTVRGLARGDKLVRWSPDGRGIWVYRNDPLIIRVERVDLATGVRSHVTEISPVRHSGLQEFVYLRLTDDPRVYGYVHTNYSSALFTVDVAR
jgi:tRNA A-37 threonylcarbamoyl transferase component Bud32/dipeptidyl aminopeptidase/acylaminoacyl peptidase